MRSALVCTYTREIPVCCLLVSFWSSWHLRRRKSLGSLSPVSPLLVVNHFKSKRESQFSLLFSTSESKKNLGPLSPTSTNVDSKSCLLQFLRASRTFWQKQQQNVITAKHPHYWWKIWVVNCCCFCHGCFSGCKNQVGSATLLCYLAVQVKSSDNQAVYHVWKHFSSLKAQSRQPFTCLFWSDKTKDIDALLLCIIWVICFDEKMVPADWEMWCSLCHKIDVSQKLKW